MLHGMHLSELITIYLAIGAPFGVHYFFQNKAVSHRILKSIGISLLWHLVIIRFFLNIKTSDENTCADSDQKLDRAKRSLFATLNEIQTRLKSEDIEILVCIIRDNAEKYAGLAQVADSLDEKDVPSEHELETFRIDGCKGEELKTASRCTHRRNVRRIVEHRNRARKDLLHALSEIKESSSALLINAADSRQTDVLLQRLYVNAIEFFTLLEDKEAVAFVTRLLGETSTRLQRDDKREVIGEEECLSTVRQHLAQTSQ